MPKSSIAAPLVRRRFTSARLIQNEYESGNATTAPTMISAGRASSHPNAASERRRGLARALTELRRSDQGPLELDDLLEALRDGHRAANDVVDDRHGFRVVLRIPRLLVRGDDLAL